MKSRILIAVLFTIALAKVSLADDCSWRTPHQVKKIALAAQLATFPLPQGELPTVIGVTRLPHLGVSTDAQGGVYGIVALTDPGSAVGYYAARMVYGLKKEEEPATIPILSMQVLFISRAVGNFVAEMDKSTTLMLPDLRKRMLDRKLTPIGFAESFYKTIQEDKGPN